MDNIVIYMKKWGLIIAIISVLSFKVKAQRKIIFDLNVGINKSIGANLLKTESILGNDVQYYSTQRYKYPYANVTSSALFRINKDFYLGLRSGLYIYFLQEYITSAQRTTVSLPLLLTSRLNIFRVNKNLTGLDLSAGINYFHIDDILEHYGSGRLINACFFYLVKEKHLLKIGLEQQADNVQYDIYKLNPNSSIRFFNYKIHRLSMCLTFGFQL